MLTTVFPNTRVLTRAGCQRAASALGGAYLQSCLLTTTLQAGIRFICDPSTGSATDYMYAG